MFHKISLSSIFVLLAFVLSGCCALSGSDLCAGIKPDTGILLRADIMVSGNANPDSDGRPSPVTIRIYQLSAGSSFRDAGFASLNDDDEAVLGADLVFKEEMDVHPGAEIPFERKLKKTTRYLGVMVAFRDSGNAVWHALTDLPAMGEFPIVIEIDGSSVSIWPKD
uniref:Type VI secretion system protein VasD n=1 Tax=Candidatus Kentrum sp. FW TaxID=2126338 RepID=A0A450TLW5_9GAMM|nr:MAG: type VI secretion system protein VasD [Candidatus Kentron sp. FW]VFJ68692.1 MAG: type VI secretion system protein VasD [Candidatus Kentron sp. FW]